MEILTPTEDELEALQHGAGFEPQTIPDPSPEIIERAKVIVGQTTPGPEPEPEVSDHQKLAFVAHVLGGVPYTERLSLLGGQLVLEFHAVSAELDNLCAKAAEPYTGREREVRYRDCQMLASICPPVVLATDTPKEADSKLIAWQSEVSREAYLVMRDAYLGFSESLEAMIRRADDPDFWPTPS